MKSFAIFHFQVNFNFHVFAKMLCERDAIKVRTSLALIDGGDIEE